MDILVADDEADIREQVCAILEDEGYQVRACATIAEAEAAIEQRLPSMAILDVWFQHCHKDGLKLLQSLQTLSPGLPVIMVSGHSTVDMAVRALKDGACDFLTKPFSLQGLLHAVERGLREAKLIRDNQEMAHQLGLDNAFAETQSPTMQTVLKHAEQWAKTERRLFITGESGVGKSYLAQHIHQQSTRARGGLQRHNCADFSYNELEGEVLFGSDLTGIGKIELAHYGTLLLENIESLSEDMQQRLSHFLQTRQFQRDGQDTFVKVDVRILSTSTLSLAELKENKNFLASLLDQLALGVLEVPALRHRREDFPSLVKSIQKRLSQRFEQAPPLFSTAGMAALQKHSWPNNIRELENVLIRLHYVGAELTAEHVQYAIGDEEHHQQQGDAARWEKLFPELDGKLRIARKTFEQYFLRYHLDRFHGNISKTAKFVGLDRASLHRKMRSLDGEDAVAESDEQEEKVR